MAISQTMIEEIGAWCFGSASLAEERAVAKRVFFGEDDPNPVRYIGGAEERMGRERRFLGWFMFDYALASGQKPAEVAARELYAGGVQSEVLTAVAGARFVNAIVASVIKRSVFLELEEDSFEVRNPIWAANMAARQTVFAHIVPIRYGYWFPAPGWLVWPFAYGPGIRAQLKQLQIDPIGAERCLQRRPGSEDDHPTPPAFDDRTLAKAVRRITEWAEERGYSALVMPVEEWQSLFAKYVVNLDAGGFLTEVLAKIGPSKSQDDLQEIADLTTNIWNNAPQPDRGGKSARQLLNRRRGSEASH